MLRTTHSKPPARRDWRLWRAAERPIAALNPHARRRLALAYANSYHVGMSSLGFQRTYELLHGISGWTAERFFVDGDREPRSVELETPLSAFPAIAFSVSFEEDFVGLVQMLTRARIPVRRHDREQGDPLVIMGGSCATINPLPMFEFVDVFTLGAAENLLPQLTAALESGDREAALDELADQPGFYVPSRHGRVDADPDSKLRKLDLTGEQMRLSGHLPSSAIITPHTEFADKLLIEMSRGCPEKCRYCWATFGMGGFRWHPTEFILSAMERGRAVTDQVGFLATAVGDHPEIETILAAANELGYRSAVSSIRIPAVTEAVLAELRRSGDRSITLAPETGSDELRIKLNKPIPNQVLLDKVRLIFRHGFTQLKLYFIVGMPGEREEDVEAILDLARECRAIMLEELAPTGVIGQIQLGVNVLIPKPYTGWQREPMAPPAELKAKLRHLRKGVAALPNVSMSSMSIKQAIWQAWLSKGGPEVADGIEAAVAGETVASLLRRFEPEIDATVYRYLDGDLAWHFMRAA